MPCIDLLSQDICRRIMAKAMIVRTVQLNETRISQAIAAPRMPIWLTSSHK
jgi:hypothetical protein